MTVHFISLHSESLENRDIIVAAFGRQPRGVTLYIHAPGLGPNVLTYDGVRESLLLIDRVRNVTAVASQRDEPERVYTYNDLCEKRTSGPSESLLCSVSLLLHDAMISKSALTSLMT